MGASVQCSGWLTVVGMHHVVCIMMAFGERMGGARGALSPFMDKFVRTIVEKLLLLYYCSIALEQGCPWGYSCEICA